MSGNGIRTVVLAMLLIVPLLGFSSSVHAESKIAPLQFVGAEKSPPFSYVSDGQFEGLINDLAKLLEEVDPRWAVDLKLYPWSRSQWLVENGLADMFCTYPSQSRKEYALFTEAPVFIFDYGNLVFLKGNPNSDVIRNAQNFEDLRDLVVVVQHGAEWEAENIPGFIKREFVSSHEEALKILLRRGKGDFLVMSKLEATYYARENGMEDVIEQVAVDFIPDGQIPFHFGISKKSEGADTMIAALEGLLQSEAFQKGRQEIMTRYTTVNAQ